MRYFSALADFISFDPRFESLFFANPAGQSAQGDGDAIWGVPIETANIDGPGSAPGNVAEPSNTGFDPTIPAVAMFSDGLLQSLGLDEFLATKTNSDISSGANAIDFSPVLTGGGSSQFGDTGDGPPSASGHAPDGAPPTFAGPAIGEVAVQGGGAADGQGIATFDGGSAARGGNPGRPGGGGGDDDGGTGGGTGILDEYFSGSADGTLGYDIWLDFKGSGWTVDLQSAFILSADYFTSVITDDIGGGGRYRGKTIDDLYVTAELKAIDGDGGILGSAGPTAVWTANDLTAAGQMQFDIADAGNYLNLGLWDDIVTHELMHVLGFGTLWNYGDHAGLVINGDQYEGTAGLEAYQRTEDPLAKYIPVAGAHWDEEALGNELMTGFIDDPNYLSEFSVMSLDDLGYAVDNYYPYDDALIA